MEEKRIMIMGVGNILLTDEGFGVRAVEYLQAKYTWPENVRLEDGGTQGLLLMSTLMECDTLVVLDVVLGPEKPGTVYMVVKTRAKMHRASATPCTRRIFWIP